MGIYLHTRFISSGKMGEVTSNRDMTGRDMTHASIIPTDSVVILNACTDMT